MGMLFLTKQILPKRGLGQFGKAGAEAVIKELQQLDYQQVIEPVQHNNTSRQQKHKP